MNIGSMRFLCFLIGFSAVATNVQIAASQQTAPAPVVVAKVESGRITPRIELIGTVFFQEVSEVAAEVRGKVELVAFDEGDRVGAGEVLVRLDSELLSKAIEAISATYEQVLVDIEKARIEFERVEKLFTEEFVSEQIYDENRFRLKGLRKKAAAIEAEIDGLNVELSKKTIRAPFDGLVIQRSVDRGEWVEPGNPVSTIARVDAVDVVVDVPEAILGSIKPGLAVIVKVSGKKLKGEISAIVPRGDVRTRTFPVKIRVINSGSLIEGMEARVSLPSGRSTRALMVPRDAVITKFGKTVVFVIEDSKARMVPVKVVGYSGARVGVEARELSKGLQVVIKGNERLSDGQAVSIGSNGPGGPGAKK